MVTYLLVSYTLTVVEESPKATAVEMIQDCEQEMLIELKGCRKLRGQNPVISKTPTIMCLFMLLQPNSPLTFRAIS